MLEAYDPETRFRASSESPLPKYALLLYGNSEFNEHPHPTRPVETKAVIR